MPKPAYLGIYSHNSCNIKHTGMIGQKNISFPFSDVLKTPDVDFLPHEGEDGFCPEAHEEGEPFSETKAGHNENQKNPDSGIGIKKQKNRCG